MLLFPMVCCVVMARAIDRDARVPALIQGFDMWLQHFERNPAFKRSGQLENHVETIRRRREHTSVATALADTEFINSLYRTLNAWQIGQRRSILLPLPQFQEALQGCTSTITAFEHLAIDNVTLDTESIAADLWALIVSLGITDNFSKVVASTKALHHLLPDLVVPVDRRFTGSFFRWRPPQFQSDDRRIFCHSFAAFSRIAKAVNPIQYVGRGWNTSRTKVIDNAIVGMLQNENNR